MQCNSIRARFHNYQISIKLLLSYRTAIEPHRTIIEQLSLLIYNRSSIDHNRFLVAGKEGRLVTIHDKEKNRSVISKLRNK